MKTSDLLLVSIVYLAIKETIAFSSQKLPNAASPTTTRLFDAPEPLATEGEWTAYLDEETTGVVYYFNSRTGESRWEPPTKTFPSVYLKPSRRRKAEAKRDEYFKSMKKKDDNFVSKLLGGLSKEEESEAVEVLNVEEEPRWMKGMLEEKYSIEQDGKPGFFSRFMNRQSQATETAPAPAPAAGPAPEPVPQEKPKKGFLDSVFETMTADAVASTKGSPFFTTPTGETETGRIAKEEAAKELAKSEAEQNKQKEEKRALEAQAKARADEERKKVDEEKKMMEMVRKAEAEQRAETLRLEAEAKKASLEAKKAEAAEAKRIAATAAAAAEEEAKRATALQEQIIVEEKLAPIKIDIGSCVLPHPSKILWGGEDAVFTKGRTFGIFDGVSGADKLDGLPLYSKMLAQQMAQLVGTGEDITIQEMQSNLLAAAEEADKRATGASTAIVASITKDGFLRAINLGDSVCIVVRGDKIVARTSEIIHYFDCPYQLSESSPDRPRDARKLNFELLRGDIVLMGSDGVFDNLEDSEIIEMVKSGPAKAAAIAKRVSDRSRKVSLNSKAVTPYSRQAKRNGDPDFRDGLGGKVDDISCIVARYE